MSLEVKFGLVSCAFFCVLRVSGVQHSHTPVPGQNKVFKCSLVLIGVTWYIAYSYYITSIKKNFNLELNIQYI